MAMAFALFGASIGRYATSTHLVQMRSHKMYLVPSVEREGAVSKTLNLNTIEMTDNRINAAFRCAGISGLKAVQQLHFKALGA